MGLTKLAITRPVFMLMMMLMCIFGGWQAFNSMRKEENPEVSFGSITITTIYPGAGPDEVNTLITRKVEESVSGINGLIEVTGASQEGVSVVVCQFDVSQNINEALSDVRTKVDGIVSQLPREVEKPIVEKFDTTSSPVFTLAVNSDGRTSQQLRDLVDQRIKDRIGQLKGVASVLVSGGDIREIQVQVRREALSKFGVGILDVQRAVQAASLNVPAGRVVQGNREASVRVLGEFKSADDLRDMVLSIQNPNAPFGKGVSVRLGEVATILDTTTERRSYSRLDGQDAITLIVSKTRNGNAVEIDQGLKALMPQLEKEFNVKFVVTFNSAKTIEESLSDLNLALFLGIALVALIVYIFLHNLRGTVIVAIAIPVCLMATIALMKLFGFTINNLSMLALSLAIGVLVDDAIVVLENIFRHLRMGEEPVEAALNGRNEIGLAAIAITLADVVVFVPVGLMGGVVGQFFRPLGLGFALCVFLSLIVSFTITPMLAARWYRKGENVEHFEKGFAGWFERGFARFAGGYRRILEWSLNHRWFVFFAGWVVLFGVFAGLTGSGAESAGKAAQGAMSMATMFALGGIVIFLVRWIFQRRVTPGVVILGLLFAAYFPLAGIAGYQYRQWKGTPLFGFQFFPVSDGGRVSINIQTPIGTSLERTGEIAREVEKFALNHPETKYVVTRVGSKGGGFSAADVGSAFAQIDVTLHDKVAFLDTLTGAHRKEKLRRVPDTTVAADLLVKIGKVPGAEVRVSAGGQQGFGSPIQMSFRSDNRELLVQTAETIRKRLAAGEVAGVINVDISSKAGKPEIQAIPDRVRLADHSMTTADLSSAMRTLYEGNTDTKFRVNGQEYDVRVMLDLEDRNNPDIVGQIPIKFSQGQPIYISSVAELKNAVGLDKIDRRSRLEEIRITADLVPGKAAGTVQDEIDKWLKANALVQPGVTQKNLGQADVQAREMGYLMGALGTGFLLVYMLLASLYNNLLYPFIIQLAQPQALVGALLALILTDKSLNIVGFIGIIALVGLVGKNAILLVDYTNTLRERGMKRHDALVEAGPTRLRPIMMTTIAVILGLLPVALAIGRGSEFRETIGIIIIGGITLSTVLTLLVIPCSYTIFDDLYRKLSKRAREQEA